MTFLFFLFLKDCFGNVMYRCSIIVKFLNVKCYACFSLDVDLLDMDVLSMKSLLLSSNFKVYNTLRSHCFNRMRFLVFFSPLPG